MNRELAQGRYVGPLPQEQDSEELKDRVNRVVAALRVQQDAPAKLGIAIDADRKELGYGG